MTPKIVEIPSYPVSIFIGGDLQTAIDVCKEYADEIGYCVTVTETQYVHTSRIDSGVIVGLINYPRFPAEPEVIRDHAKALAHKLLNGLKQESFSIQSPDTTVWYSYRPGDVSE